MKKGAIFDMDGLMFDTETLWQEGWRKLAGEYGYKPSSGFGRDISGTSGKLMLEVVNRYYPNVDAEEFIKKGTEYVEECLKKDVPLKPGLFTILNMFKNYDVKMAVASASGEDMIRQNLKKSGS